jgi:hypothetical protein
MLGLHLEGEDDQAALLRHVASRRSTRFLWNGLGIAVLLLIGVSAWVMTLPVASHAPTMPSRLLPSVAFAPFLPALSPAGVHPASHPVSSHIRPTGVRPAVLPAVRQRPQMSASRMSSPNFHMDGVKVSSPETPQQRYGRGSDSATKALRQQSKSFTMSAAGEPESDSDDSAAHGEPEFDAIVIGGGSGGSGFAKRAAGYGAKVCLIERGAQWDENGVRTGAGPGGTCVNVGCVPKKLMFNAAAHREMMVGGVETAKGYGFDVPSSAGNFDWGGLKERRDAYVKRLNDVYEGGWDKL